MADRIFTLHGDRTGFLVICRGDGRVQGYIQANPRDDVSVTVKDIWVDAPYRSRGLGTELVQRLQQWAAHNAFQEILVPDAIVESSGEFFPALGFAARTGFYEFHVCGSGEDR